MKQNKHMSYILYLKKEEVKKTISLLTIVALILAVVFSGGAFFGFPKSARAYLDAIDPSGNGTLAPGTQTTCGAGGEYDCLNDLVRSPGSVSTSGDYVTYVNGDASFFTMTNNITNVDTVTQVQVYVFHGEGGANMNTQVALYDANEVTVRGAVTNVPTRTTPQWDSVTFSGLSLTQAQLDNLDLRLSCIKGAGGGTNCVSYAAYADVTYSQVQNVTVSAIGSQAGTLDIPTDNNYVGGTFVITENTSSRNVTSITIAEQGSVDAQNSLNDIRLYYDLDTSNPYNCVGETYLGGEPQFGATSTSFSSANGTSTFSGSVAIATTSTMCVYAVLDIGSGASGGQDIEIQITDPSADVVVSTGIVGPGTAVLLPGTTSLNQLATVYDQRDYRIYENANAVQPTIPMAATNTPAQNIEGAEVFRIRMNVAVSQAPLSANTEQFKLQYANKGVEANCTDVAGGSFADVGGIGSGTIFRGYDQTPTDGATLTGFLLATSSNVLETYEEANNTASNTNAIAVGQRGEWDFVVQNNGANSEDSYCFRMVRSNDTAFTTYTNMPEITIVAPLTQVRYRWRNDDGGE